MADAGKKSHCHFTPLHCWQYFFKNITNVGNSPLQAFWFSNNHPSKKFWPFFNAWAWVANKVSSAFECID